MGPVFWFGGEMECDRCRLDKAAPPDRESELKIRPSRAARGISITLLGVFVHSPPLPGFLHGIKHYIV